MSDSEYPVFGNHVLINRGLRLSTGRTGSLGVRSVNHTFYVGPSNALTMGHNLLFWGRHKRLPHDAEELEEWLVSQSLKRARDNLRTAMRTADQLASGCVQPEVDDLGDGFGRCRECGDKTFPMEDHYAGLGHSADEEGGDRPIRPKKVAP